VEKEFTGKILREEEIEKGEERRGEKNGWLSFCTSNLYSAGAPEYSVSLQILQVLSLELVIIVSPS